MQAVYRVRMMDGKWRVVARRAGMETILLPIHKTRESAIKQAEELERGRAAEL